MSALVQSVTGTSDSDGKGSGMNPKGAFVRGVSTCRNVLDPAGAYPPEPNRYHLYVGVNCPWCHRVLITRAVLGLQDTVSMDVCFPSRTDEEDSQGRSGLWQFQLEGQVTRNGRQTEFPECTAETVMGGKHTVVEIYDELGIEQKSVPILFDKKTRTIVNNESAEIVRMLGTFAKELGSNMSPPPVLYPAEHTTREGGIDEVNEWIYHTINNGAYKAGFTGSQDSYEEAYEKYFASLARLNEIFSRQKFVAADVVTEADVRLFPTLFRHDSVYHSRFKLSQAYLWQFPNVWRWMGTMIREVPGLQESATKSLLQHCKQGYYGRTGSNTIPLGPEGYPECFLVEDYCPPVLGSGSIGGL